MKNLALKISLMSMLALVVFAFSGPVSSYQVNTGESNIKWTASKVTGTHYGDIKVKEGSLTFENDMLTGGSFVIDMTTINVLDLEGEWKGKLEGHLKSPDFFSVEKHSTATFNITQVVSRGTAGDYKVVGDITIKGITKEIRFQTHIDDMGNTMKATADVQLDRTDFDIRYGSGSFFDNLGDKTIYDEFDLNISLVVNK